MKICVIVAHPDDVEISAFGTLKIFQEAGHEIFTVTMTKGNLQGSKRIEESKNALWEFINNYMNYEDSNLKETCDLGIIEEINPDLVITHAENDYHNDHKNLSKAVSNFCSFKFPVVYFDNFMGVNSSPKIFIDISKFKADKKEAIMKHKSQNPERLVYASFLLGEFRAAQCGYRNKQFECFDFNPRFPFMDVRDLMPKSAPIVNRKNYFFTE
jgi:N-acetylglucosamine malate deacetylase 1